jgi:hypothetical protein
MCNYKCRKFETGHGVVGQCFSFWPLREFNPWDGVFPFRGKGLNSYNVSISCKEMCVLYYVKMVERGV